MTLLHYCMFSHVQSAADRAYSLSGWLCCSTVLLSLQLLVRLQAYAPVNSLCCVVLCDMQCFLRAVLQPTTVKPQPANLLVCLCVCVCLCFPFFHLEVINQNPKRSHHLCFCIYCSVLSPFPAVAVPGADLCHEGMSLWDLLSGAFNLPLSSVTELSVSLWFNLAQCQLVTSSRHTYTLINI